MFRIGEFSQISRVTIDTLRYYDAIDLLKPAKVDSATGYRYYETQQLHALNQIIALKEIGFSLDVIGRILREPLSSEALQGMLKAQLALTESQLDAIQLQRDRIVSRLKKLEEGENASAFEITLKSTDAFTVAGLRETVPTAEQVPQRWGEMFQAIAAWALPKRLTSGPAMTFYHNNSFSTENIDTECAFVLRRATIDEAMQPESPLYIRQVAAVAQMATTFVPDYRVEGLEPAYRAIGQWICEHGFHIAGAPRELYYGSPADGDFSAEIQFPIRKGKQQ
ncbi:MAG: MerR family transcriptional regulator [Chloroflexota bacterium]